MRKQEDGYVLVLVPSSPLAAPRVIARSHPNQLGHE